MGWFRVVAKDCAVKLEAKLLDQVAGLLVVLEHHAVELLACLALFASFFRASRITVRLET
jgi:hypothetical protein